VYPTTPGNFSESDLVIANADGSGSQILLHQTGAIEEPHWSPDSRTLIYTYNNGTSLEVDTVRANGGRPAQLLGAAYDGIFSPDGKKVAFLRKAADSPSGYVDVWTASATGTQPHDVADTPDIEEDTLSWAR
jgi:Tol biopolymer transport system component